MEQPEIDVRSVYEKHARACDPKDFQSQVMRTRHGKPVGRDQIALMIEGISQGLALTPQDVLLDLCCGNGAVTDPIFASCRGGIGVDFTPYLIEIAKANFEKPPERLYRLSDAVEYVETTDDTGRFTKVLCYGAFQCLPEAKATALLRAIYRRFPNVRCVSLGNLPDLDRARLFWRQDFGSEPWPLCELKRYDTVFGIWRTEKEITKLASETGWGVQISRMPPLYYGAHYRFDAILTRH